MVDRWFCDDFCSGLYNDFCGSFYGIFFDGCYDISAMAFLRRFPTIVSATFSAMVSASQLVSAFQQEIWKREAYDDSFYGLYIASEVVS